MLISIDYDDTFTLDPEFWRQVVELGELRGHSFVCVTARNEPPDPMREPALPGSVPVVCTGGLPKAPVAMRKGFNVNVWIDDMPGMISGGLLDWGNV
jgi:hypothetical protein